MSEYKLRRDQSCRSCAQRIRKGETAYVQIDGYGARIYRHPDKCPRVDPSTLPGEEPDWAEASQNYAEAMKAGGGRR